MLLLRTLIVLNLITFIITRESIPPEEIHTQPDEKIVVNAPYDKMHKYHIKVINTSIRERIAYSIKVNDMKRLAVDLPVGVLDPKEAVLLTVFCDAFDFGQEDTDYDRITIEWRTPPKGTPKEFRRQWFQANGVIRRKDILIEYNSL